MAATHRIIFNFSMEMKCQSRGEATRDGVFKSIILSPCMLRCMQEEWRGHGRGG